MSFFLKVKLWLTPRKTLREQAEHAYGLWLVSPRTTNATNFVSNMTGIPRDEVWGILFGRNEND